MNKLSIIMATYNEDINFLRLCVDSVLQQTLRDFEFIITTEPNEKNIDYLRYVSDVDNRVKILKNELRLGVAASRNRAIEESSGDFIAIIDGDDYCHRDRFKKQIDVLNDNPEISVVGSNMYLVDAKNKIVGERKYPESHDGIKRRFLITMAVANPAVMVRKKDFDETGLFNNDFHKAEDLELWLRFLTKGMRMYNIQENLIYYRIPSGHNAKRGSLHWRNLYTARKKYSRFIWPLYQRFPVLLAYLIISHIPNSILDRLLGFGIVNRLKNIDLK